MQDDPRSSDRRPAVNSEDRNDAGARPTILVVEDDDDLRRTLVDWLTRTRELEVLPARDGEEAREWSQDTDRTIDLALIDLVLPDSFGARVALDQAFLRPNIKTIFMSGYVPDDPVLAASLKSNPKAHFLKKPFQLEELGRVIDELLGNEESA